VEEIDDFLRKHGRNFNGAHVNELRHIIPLFLMEVEVKRFGSYTKKGCAFSHC